MLRAQALTLLDAQAWGWAYNWGRFSLPGASLFGPQLEPVRAPFRRHCVTLPPSDALRAATALMARVALAAGMPPTARLLESDTTIALPGAFCQATHTDISPSVSDRGGAAPLVTVWLALQGVTAAMGPTTVYPGSHHRYAQRAVLQEERNVQADADSYARVSYSSDGSGGPPTTLVSMHEEGNGAALYVMDAEMDAAELRDVEREAAEFGDVPGPVDLILEAGDAGLMDCRVRHFGSAYRYTRDGVPRVLLNATFGCGESITGFTYHRHSGMAMPTLQELTEAC